jgi:hypothetical protein
MVSSAMTAAHTVKKRAAVSGGFEVDNREASKQSGQEPLGPKDGQTSHTSECLTARK